MITDLSAYTNFLEHLETQPEVALDTEADSLHCYFEKLCLIQVGCEGGLHLIDPLVGLPISKFFEALHGKTLLFHDADYDLRLLRRSGVFPDTDIFDTMIAARLCGEPQLGLAALVEKYFGVKLSKASRKANWGMRPLSPEMIEYALNDVRYLRELAAIFREKLEELDRMEWFFQSCSRMINGTKEVRTRDEKNLWRISGHKTLSFHAQAILRAIWQWRDEEARKWDKPPFYVMSNHEMLDIADRAAQGKKYKLPKLTPARSESLEETITRAKNLPPEMWPKNLSIVRIRATKQEANYFKKLKEIRDRIARDLELDPSIIAPKSALESAVSNDKPSLLLPWQSRLLGLDKEKK